MTELDNRLRFTYYSIWILLFEGSLPGPGRAIPYLDPNLVPLWQNLAGNKVGYVVAIGLEQFHHLDVNSIYI